MTIPALLFGILISTLMGAGMHVVVGGSPWRLGLFILLAWVGFWAGHLLGAALGFIFLAVGPLKLGMALLGAAALLLIGYWLSLVQVEKK